jgi:GNAT superfamily N-acetyltransferase
VVEIRDATAGDAEAIAETNAAAWRTAYRGLIEQDRLDGIPVKAWARDIARNLAEIGPGSFSLVAVQEGRVAGSCFVLAPARDGDLGPEVIELVAIYVDPLQWGRGIGRALVEEAVERAEREGFGEMSLWTLRDNTAARNFYQRLGWRPDGREQIHPAARAPAVRMRRELSPSQPRAPGDDNRHNSGS